MNDSKQNGMKHSPNFNLLNICSGM